MGKDNLYNVEIEQLLLSYIIRDYQFLGEIPLINKDDFTPDVNRIVFEAIKYCVKEHKEGFSKFLLIDKLKALNIKIGGDVTPSDYISSLDIKGRDLDAKAAIGLAKQVKYATVRRKIYEMGAKIAEIARDNPEKPVDELINETSLIFNKEINILDSNDDEPKDIYEHLESVLKQSNPINNNSLEPPFPIYQKAYGNFDPGDITVIVARPKDGKSTILLSSMNHFANKYNKDEFVCLILDTELELRRAVWRSTSQRTGVHEYFLKNGEWNNDIGYSEKVQKLMGACEPLKGKVYHQFCGGKTLEEQVTIAKRFHQKYVAGTGKKFIIVLDYIKLGSSDLKNTRNVSLFLEAGLKIDRWKTVSIELDCHILTACQANRLGENNDEEDDDGSIVSLSDMISQFSSTVLRLRKISEEKKYTFGIDASHSLHTIYTRNWGHGSNEFFKPVQYTTMEHGKPKMAFSANHIFYKFDSFAVSEICDFRDIVDKKKIVNVNMGNNGKQDLAIF